MNEAPRTPALPPTTSNKEVTSGIHEKATQVRIVSNSTTILTDCNDIKYNIFTCWF